MADAPPASSPPVLAVAARGPDGRDGALDIGTLLPRSGDLAFLGAAALAGVELAVDDLEAAGGVLDEPVGLRHGDSAEGEPGTAEAEVATLLEAGADVIIGPLSSATAARVLGPVAAADALLITPASTSNGLDVLDREGRLFRTAPTEALQGRGLADLLLADGHRTASIAARADEYGRTMTDALVQRLEADGGSVVSRIDYDPSAPTLGEDVADELDTTADALVLVGLSETAAVLDALAAAGQRPRDRPVYGTDGNLGERLGDLVADRADLACMRGLLPVAVPEPGFAARVRSHDPALAELDGAALDLAAESYDAVAIAGLAAAAAGTDSGAALATALPGVTRAGVTCDDVADCLALLAQGADPSYRGRTGRIALDAAGNRDEAALTVVAFDDDGHLARLGTRRVRG